MKHHNEPIIGTWYDATSFPESFAVVGYDDNSDYVEIQYLDGELDKVDVDLWDTLKPHEIAEPEDATAPYGIDLEPDDEIIKLLDTIEESQDLHEHLRHIDSYEEQWY